MENKNFEIVSIEILETNKPCVVLGKYFPNGCFRYRFNYHPKHHNESRGYYIFTENTLENIHTKIINRNDR